MTEIFDGLSMIADPISEKDHVVHYFASQSARLVHAGYCSWGECGVVTEWFLHEEWKLKEQAGVDANSERAITGKQQPKAKGPSATTVESSVISGRPAMSGSRPSLAWTRRRPVTSWRQIEMRRDRETAAVQTVTASGWWWTTLYRQDPVAEWKIGLWTWEQPVTC